MVLHNPCRVYSSALRLLPPMILDFVFALALGSCEISPETSGLKSRLAVPKNTAIGLSVGKPERMWRDAAGVPTLRHMQPQDSRRDVQ